MAQPAECVGARLWQGLEGAAQAGDAAGQLAVPALPAHGARHARHECDHVVPKAQGGTDDEGNMQAICADCHKAKTEREAAEGQGRRLRPSFGEDGWLIGPE